MKTMTDTTTAPRCPACGGVMFRFGPDGDWWCTPCATGIHLPATTIAPARVPCPACEGRGVVTSFIVTEGGRDVLSERITIQATCQVCRVSGTVSAALAAAWTADAQRSGEEG